MMVAQEERVMSTLILFKNISGHKTSNNYHLLLLEVFVEKVQQYPRQQFYW